MRIPLRRSLLGLSLLGSFLIASPLFAQADERRVMFTGAVGFARQGGPSPRGGPTGDLLELPTVGYSVVGSAELATFTRALKLRADATFADFAGANQIGGLSAGFVLVRPSGTVRPYLLGSGGFYTLRGVDDGPGYSVGGGLRVRSGTRTFFAETRVHNYPVPVGDRAAALNQDSRRTLWVPISVGFVF